MRISGLMIAAWLMALQLPAAAADFWTVVPSRKIDGCQTLAACMAILDRLPKWPYGSTSPDDPKVAAYLKRFGEPAKQALLERAGRSDHGWSNYAGALLMEWTDFTSADVPALIKGLQREPGGWISRPLAMAGTPEAIAALTEDVRLHGGQSQSGWALKGLGLKAVPYLMPLLENDKTAYEASSVLSDMGDTITPLAPDWTALALDTAQPAAKRIAALRALSALGAHGAAQGPALRPLLQDGNPKIAAAATTTLTAIGDRSALDGIVASCQPATYKDAPDPYSSIRFNAWCLQKIAAHGADAKPFAPVIVERFLKSPNGVDRNTGAATLGYIGYDAAVPALIGLLKDPDWRVVYAAARSLSWLRAASAVPALTQVARDHWLSDVRKEAQAALDSLRPGAAALDKPAIRLGGSQSPDVPLEIDATFAPDVAPCTSGHWRYGGIAFDEPHVRRMQVASGVAGGGTFSAADDGEWGGGMWWHSPDDTGPLLPRNDANSAGVEASSTGAVAAFGEIGMFAPYRPEGPGLAGGNAPSGNGYVLSLTMASPHELKMTEIARLTRGPDVMTAIGPDLYAVWAGNRAVVFSLQGIQGVAVCVP